MKLALATLSVALLLQAAAPAAGLPDQAASARRIVAVGGAITEILYDLGFEDRIVGVDSTSLYPPRALKDKANVGYMRQLSPEGVLGLNPDLVIATENAGPKDAMTMLRDAKVPLAIVPERNSEQGVIEKIRIVAKTMRVEQRGACLIEAVAGDLAHIRELTAQVAAPKRVLFVMSLIDGRAMVAGRATAADAVIGMAGARNAIESFEGYKTISAEAVEAARPDAVLVMQRAADTLNADAVFATPAFALTPAAQSRSFIAMDGLYLLGFGPRTASAAHDLAAALYPAVLAKDAAWRPRASKADCRSR